MKKIMLTILLITGITFAAYDIDKLIKDYNNDKVYEDATAINLYTDVKFEIEADQSYTKHVFYLKKIVDYAGKKRYSDVVVEYDPDFESVELITSLTIDPEMKKHEVPENQIYDLNTRSSLRSPEYVNDRKKVVNFPGIEPDFFIVMEYKITNTRKTPANSIIHFQESNPYVVKKLTLSYPENLELKYWNHKDISMEKKNEEGKNIYSWIMKDVPLIKEEPSTPDYIVIGKPVVFTFYKDWKEYAKLNLAKINNIEITEEVKKLASSIVGDIKNDEDKIKGIYNFLAENYIQKYSVVDQMDYQPEPFEKIIGQKYGASRDLTALFIAMARSIGIKDIFPVLKLHRSYNDFEQMRTMALEGFINDVEVYYNGTLLSVGKSTGPFGFTGNYENILVSPLEDKCILDYKYPETITRQRNYKYTLSSADIKLETSWLLKASSDMGNRWFKRFPEEQRKMYFAQYALNDKAAEITSGPDFKNLDKLDKPLEISFDISYKDRIITQENYKYFKIIEPNLLNVALKERVNDYKIGNKIYYRDEIEIVPETASQIINIEDLKLEFQCEGKTAYIKLEVKENKDNITMVRTIYIPEMTIKPEKYTEFRNFILGFQKPIYSMVFLKK
ncbi:MAG: DUF3857 and transglutaminase domain-containing protein [Candidatus Delongbacteria bacterium]|nr:DUF3857 and transglutaminase domain-containing protein [Candidatus Delongbacteria bacterium]